MLTALTDSQVRFNLPKDLGFISMIKALGASANTAGWSL